MGVGLFLASGDYKKQLICFQNINIAINMLLLATPAGLRIPMNSFLEQLKQRRKALGLKQHDMMLRVGMSRQQYQQLESRGNPRLNTLELIAKGLNSELMLIPNEKLPAVRALLGGDTRRRYPSAEGKSLADDPWHDVLGELGLR